MDKVTPLAEKIRQVVFDGLPNWQLAKTLTRLPATLQTKSALQRFLSRSLCLNIRSISPSQFPRWNGTWFKVYPFDNFLLKFHCKIVPVQNWFNLDYREGGQEIPQQFPETALKAIKQPSLGQWSLNKFLTWSRKSFLYPDCSPKVSGGTSQVIRVKGIKNGNSAPVSRRREGKPKALEEENLLEGDSSEGKVLPAPPPPAVATFQGFASQGRLSRISLLCRLCLTDYALIGRKK